VNPSRLIVPTSLLLLLASCAVLTPGGEPDMDDYNDAPPAEAQATNSPDDAGVAASGEPTEVLEKSKDVGGKVDNNAVDQTTRLEGERSSREGGRQQAAEQAAQAAAAEASSRRNEESYRYKNESDKKPTKKSEAKERPDYYDGGDVSEDELLEYLGYADGVVAQAPSGGEEVQRDREAYEDYGINAMTQVSSDAHSTFSIDVDTASYTIARRKLNSGVLPPTASVRVEEFVNYFDYDYVGPTGDAPFAVNMEAAPHPFQQNHHLLRFGVQGQLPDDDNRVPVHLTFLVDTSGSMSSPDKMGLVKYSLTHLVENLERGDTVALATYAGSISKVLGPTAVSEQGAIDAAIDSLFAGGSTAMSSGIDLAYEMAMASFVSGHENRVIVLSDGDANVGATSHEQILTQITDYAKKGVTLSTIGFGMGNYQDTLMEQLANDGDGNYFYIDSQTEAQKVFGDDLAGTLQVIAKDVKIQVEFNPDAVIAYRLIGYENRDIADEDFRDDAVDAGEIGAGHQVTALYDVVLRDGYREQDVAVVRLRNKTPGADSAAVEWETKLPAGLVHDEFPEASSNFRLAFGAASFAELLRGSPHTAEITYSDLLYLLRNERGSGALDNELTELIATAGRLSGESISVSGL